MEFRTLAEHFERIETASKRLELTGLVLELLRATPRALVDKVLYLLQGRIYPDFAGIELGVAEKLTLKGLSRTLGVEEKEIVALQNKVGDLGLAAEEVLKKRRQRALFGDKLTVSRVYTAFEEIAKSTGTGSQDAKLKIMGELFHNASPLEGRYLVRLLDGKLRLGVADQTFLDALSLLALKRTATSVTELEDEDRAERLEARKTVEHAMDLTSDIALVAKTLLEGGLAAVKKLKARLGVPIRPMLSERAETLEDALEKVGGSAQVEYKYDGLRIQAHVGDTVDLFSRRLERVTSQFPDLVADLDKAMKGRPCIVEGEAVAIDPKTGRIRPFQDIATRRGRKYGLPGEATTGGKKTSLDYTKKVPVRLFLFDVLYRDGEELSARPLAERRKTLEGMLRENDSIVLAEAHHFTTARELETYFDKVTTMGAEGIMIKDPRSPYQAGARGWAWIKFKADYQEGLADSFDLVAIGAYWGQGRRGGWYGALLLAARNEETGRFESVCRVATGFDDATLETLQARFEPHLSKEKAKSVDSEEEPDVWFHPQVVLEVIGAELTLSPRHRCAWGAIKEDAGLSVRFPRFTGRWRDDKKAAQATTDKELVKLYQASLKRKSGGRA